MPRPPKVSAPVAGIKGSVYSKLLHRLLEHEGEVYRSLSAVAKKVTGTHWNGYHFFKVGQKGHGNGQES